jgi:single-stranded-DNA-specific exonuclease
LTIKLENINDFIAGIYTFARQYGEQEKVKVLHIDTVLSPDEYTMESLEVVEKLAPFGEANEEPVFLLPHAVVMSVEKV